MNTSVIATLEDGDRIILEGGPCIAIVRYNGYPVYNKQRDDKTVSDLIDSRESFFEFILLLSNLFSFDYEIVSDKETIVVVKIKKPE